jgi:hypothetical protein
MAARSLTSLLVLDLLMIALDCLLEERLGLSGRTGPSDLWLDIAKHAVAYYARWSSAEDAH